MHGKKYTKVSVCDGMEGEARNQASQRTEGDRASEQGNRHRYMAMAEKTVPGQPSGS